MRVISGFLLFFVLSLSAFHVRAEGIAVLELFTSQYCADAYPADQLFHKLINEDSDLIAISCHLEAMNRDAFQDPLSQSFCDERNGSYMTSLGLRSVEMPHVVLNGIYDLGSGREKLVRSGIKMTRASAVIRSIDMHMTEGAIAFSLPDMMLGQEGADVWLYAYNDYADAVVVDEKNMPLTVPYANYATHLVKLLDWKGGAQALSFPSVDIRSDGYVILVQNPQDGILAAGRVRHFPMSTAKYSHKISE